MKIQLSDHFGYQKLLRFTLPSIVMMIFTSVYGVVDGFFVSNFVGKTSLAAVNFVWPLIMILGAVGFMFGTGGSAIVARTFGEGDPDRARRTFSLLVYVSLGLGVVITAVGLLLLRPLCVLMGAQAELLEQCMAYGYLILPAIPAYILQFEFQSFFVTAQRPQLGLWMTVLSGVLNMGMDALFVAVFRWGLKGAAAATALSQVAGAVMALIYFLRPNTSLLRLGRTKMDRRALLETCVNGSSELMSNLSMSLVGMLYNAQLIRYAGEDGVAAYSVLMYVNMIFLAAFIGYAVGTAPVVGFHYGAQDHAELKSLLGKSLRIIGICSVVMLVLAEVLARPLAAIFVGYDAQLMDLTVWAFRIYSFAFLFSGLSIFGSSFFTALSDGLTSALISFLRTLLFQSAAVLIFPLLWGVDGIWASVVAAEGVAAVVTALFLIGKRKRYHY